MHNTSAYQRKNNGYTVINYTKVGLVLLGTIAGTTALTSKTGFSSSSWRSSDITQDNALDNPYQLINPQEAITFVDNSLTMQGRHAKRAFVNEFQINTYTTLPQLSSSVAGLTTGDFVVTWASNGQDGDGYGIYGQRYSSNGISLGSEFQINTYTIGDQLSPSVAGLNSDDFVVVWQSWQQDGDSWGIYAQRYSSVGIPQGSEFQVNTYTTERQNAPSVAALSTGAFVVTWSSFWQDGDIDGIYGQRYSGTGVPQGSALRVNTYTIGGQGTPSIAALNSGDFVVVWVSNGQDGFAEGVYGQRFSNTGVPQGSEFQINIFTFDSQRAPAIAALTTGDFVVVWSSDTQDGDRDGIYGRRYSNTGIAQGSEFQINTYTTGTQHYPSVAALSTGDFMVVWDSMGQDSDRDGIYGQRFSSTGAPQGSEFQINTYTSEDQRYPAIATLTTGNLVVVWESVGQDGDSFGIYGRMYLNVNVPPELIDNALTINADSAVILSTLNLNAYDPDNAFSELTFSITNVQQGQFTHVSNASVAITNFTQRDIIDSTIQFVHDGSPNPPTYNVSVSDGALSDGPLTATISFAYIAQHQVVVQPGETLVLGPNQLDLQSTLNSTDLEIAVSSTLFCRFEKFETVWGLTNSFDLFELNTGKIRFVHDGTENKPFYFLQFKDLLTNVTFPQQIAGNTILNHPPEVVNPIGILNKELNEAFVYALPNNIFTDLDAQVLQIIVTPVNSTLFPAWIQFDNLTTTLTGTPVTIGSYPFKAIATDPYNATAEDRFYIDVQLTSGTPTVTTNALTITEDQTVVLTLSDLSADDPDDDNNTLIFTLSNIQNGQFEKVTNPGTSIITFTQLEIINNDIQFVHDGSENAPYYEVIVSDGTTASTNEAATITFINVNDAPVLNNYNILITSPGQSMTLDANFLSATDSDNDDTTLIFSISNTQNCRFESITSPGTPITTFTQQQIQNGNIQFVHTQVANLPTFQVNVSDGSLSTTPVNAMTFQIITNQLVAEPGQTAPITLDNINVLTQQPATDTRIIITNAANGYFMQTNNPGQSINNFSLQQIKDGEIIFVKDNRDNLPSYEVRFSYTNSTQITPAATPDITLNHPPVVVTKIQDQQAKKETPFDFTLSENTFSDPDGDPLTVSLEMQDGRQKPAWLQFEPNYSTNRHRFFGRPATSGGVPLRVVARDPYNASVNSDFLLQASETTSVVPIVLAITGAAALLAGSIATVVGCFTKQKDRATRKQHQFAQLIRRHLKLDKVDNFKSQEGQHFVQATQTLDNLLGSEYGINIDEMNNDELNTLASHVAEAARNKITPDTKGPWKKSKISITEFKENITEIAEDTNRRQTNLSFNENDDDIRISMQSM